MKQTRLLEIIREEISSALNEVPDFGGKLDQGVAKEFGEKNTLQNAVDKIVGETLTDMGVTLEDLKKDKAKATEALTSIREKVLGAKRKNIPQDPRVTKALEKQEDVEVATLGAISGKSLQQNQTENAIKKALGLKEPGQRGRKASEKSEPKEKSTKTKSEPKPKSEPKAKESKTDAGTDDEGNKVEIDTTVKSLTGDKEIETKLKDVISKKKDKLKAALKSKDQETYNKEKAALKQFLEKPEIAKYIKKKTVDKVNPYTISSIEDDIK
jgi:hypothetical protein